MNSLPRSIAELSPDLETSSELYATRFQGESGKFLLDRQNQIFATLLKKYPSGSLKILDVGGGHAQLTQTMLALGHKIWIHGSLPDCGQRLKTLGLQSNNVSFVISPFSELASEINKQAGQFDVVTAIRLMAHIEDWREFIRQLALIAKREIIIDFASLYSVNLLSSALYPIKKFVEKTTRPFYCQRLSQVVDCFEQLGFRVSSVHKQFALPLALHRALDNSLTSNRLEDLCSNLGLTKTIGSPIILSATRNEN